MTPPKRPDPNNPTAEEIAEILERKRIEDEARAERLYQEQQAGKMLRKRGPKVYRISQAPEVEEET